MGDNDLGSLKDEFPDKYLFAEDFLGKPATLTIAKMNSDALVTAAGKKRAVIVTFVGKKKVLVLNKTNAHLINAIFPLAPGESLKTWVGKRVTFYPTQCSMKGEIVDCIRVYGSPDLAADKEVLVQQGLKKVPMKVYAVKAVKAAAKSAEVAPDPTFVSAATPAIKERWDILGWTEQEGEKEMGTYTGTDYLAHLSSLIDQQNAQEAS